MSEQAVSILLAIVTILFCLCLFGYLIGSYIYKKKHNLPTGDCSYCHKKKGQLLKEYRNYCKNNH